MKLISDERRKSKLYKFAFVKSWFDAGYGATSYIKYFLGFVGIGQAFVAQDLKLLLIFMIGYGIFCFVLGWVMYHVPSREHNYILSEREVNNQYDYFAKEVRKKIKRKNI